MAETDVSTDSNARFQNPQAGRFGSSRSSGFSGGGSDPLGNYQPPTSLQTGGINEAAKPTPVRGVSAQETPSFQMPKQQGTGAQLAAGIATKAGGSLATNYLKDTFGAKAPISDQSSVLGVNNRDYSDYGDSDMSRTPSVGSDTFQPLDNYEFGQSYPEVDASLSAPPSMDAGSLGGFSDMAGLDFDAGSLGGASDLAGGVAGEAAGSAMPYIGPAIQALQGNVGGAVGTLAGRAIGQALIPIPVVGGIIGGIIGGAVGGGSVICTELVINGDAPLELLARELEYAKVVGPTVMRGYHFWAVPYVRLMRRNRAVYAITKPFALGWMHEAAARATGGKGSLIGKLVLGIGIPLCWTIGKFVGQRDTTTLYYAKG